jgi:2,4-dienoyl-CoA reductase-like NADH-dependent reductase (Old Yellow Enzyme family)
LDGWNRNHLLSPASARYLFESHLTHVRIPTMHLFSPLTIREITFRNRIAVSPMCQYSCVDGFATDWHLVHLGTRAVGGAALVFAEATAVTADGRISPMDLGIWKDAHIEPLARAARFIKAQGAVPGIQLAHAGRKASTNAPWLGGKPLSVAEGGWTPIVSASALPFNDGYQTPAALSVSQIAGIVAAFADAARRALDAGFEVVELHGAHGYLGNQFLSPLSNQRTDEFGGSFENRTRFLREIIEAVRKVWPQRLPIFLRISATDWMEGGWTGEDSIALAKVVKPLGVDLIDCSSGGSSALAKIPLGAGYQVPFANSVRRHATIATGAVGMITEPMQADQIIRNGEADLVIMAREFLRDPYWPLHAAATLHQEISWPLQYERAKPARK